MYLSVRAFVRLCSEAFCAVHAISTTLAGHLALDLEQGQHATTQLYTTT
jgi:hypothetical protein